MDSIEIPGMGARVAMDVLSVSGRFQQKVKVAICELQARGPGCDLQDRAPFLARQIEFFQGSCLTNLSLNVSSFRSVFRNRMHIIFAKFVRTTNPVSRLAPISFRIFAESIW